MTKRDLALAFVAIVFAVSGPAARAQSCGQAIDQLAQRYNLSTELPQYGSSVPTAPKSSSAPTRTERLAQSGGVLSPPDVGVPMAIQPPATEHAPMSTAPPLAPSPPASGFADAGSLTAAQRAQMESLLQAARAADRQGKPEECVERLRQAEAVPNHRTVPH